MSLIIVIHYFRFVAVVVVLGSVVQDQKAYNDAGIYTDTASYYIAAAWDETASSQIMNSFVVGNGNIYVARTPGSPDKITYTNVALKSNQEYSIFVRYDIENEDLGGPHEVSHGVRTKIPNNL